MRLLTLKSRMCIAVEQRHLLLNKATKVDYLPTNLVTSKCPFVVGLKGAHSEFVVDRPEPITIPRLKFVVFKLESILNWVAHLLQSKAILLKIEAARDITLHNCVEI